MMNQEANMSMNNMMYQNNMNMMNMMMNQNMNNMNMMNNMNQNTIFQEIRKMNYYQKTNIIFKKLANKKF